MTSPEGPAGHDPQDRDQPQGGGLPEPGQPGLPTGGPGSGTPAGPPTGPSWVPPGGPPSAPPGGWPGPAGVPVAPGSPPVADGYGVVTVLLWAVLGFIVMIPIGIVVQLLMLAIGGSIPGTGGGAPLRVGFALAGLLLTALPLVLAFVLMRRASTKRSAAPWLGLLIGGAVYLLAFAGICVPLVAQGL